MMGLRTTIYKVPQLAEARDWYAAAFGVAPYFENERYVGFSIKGYELGLFLDATPAEAKTDNVLSYWGVEDVAEGLDALIAQGATPHEPAQNVGGPIVVGSVRDPWGNVIGLIYNPDFKAES